LLQKDADPNRASPDGTTALMAASQAGKLAVVELLLKRNADPTRLSAKGQRALEYARAGKHQAIVELLLPLTPGDAPPPPINPSVAARGRTSLPLGVWLLSGAALLAGTWLASWLAHATWVR